MGSCVSLSRSPPDSTSAPELGRVVAKVVGLDGSMARFEGLVTSRDALSLLAMSGGLHRRASPPPPCFLCSSDEIGFDAPARALAAEEALQPGQLYFVLPAPMLRRPLSGQEMAALAVKAARALAVEAGLATAAPESVKITALWRNKGRGDGGEAAGKKVRKAARVAPLLVDQSRQETSGRSPEEGASKHNKGYEYDGERTLGKTRRGVRGARRRRPGPGVQRLGAIAEGSESEPFCF